MSKQDIREWVYENAKPSEDGSIVFHDEIELADIIHKYTQDQSGWVSVDDRLPDEDGEVYMVTDGRYVNITEYDAEDGRFIEIPACLLVSVTHWMPLPLPPTEEV